MNEYQMMDINLFGGDLKPGEVRLHLLDLDKERELDLRSGKGIIIKEKVRPLQSYVEHPAKPGNTLPGIRRKIGQNQLTEPVVGITGRHSITSTHF